MLVQGDLSTNNGNAHKALWSYRHPIVSSSAAENERVTIADLRLIRTADKSRRAQRFVFCKLHPELEPSDAETLTFYCA